ncbi:MAG: bacillithiol system redox-active protein YtxJ [Planctomycetes bacterium]|nr:bacillithiol system redox-active protein YtxJ [Planctomycetota bacterium]
MSGTREAQGPFADLASPEDVEALLVEKASAWIFKHSTRCPISAAAQEAFSRLASMGPGLPVRRVLVVESRPASNAVAERLGVPHASPQAILLRDGAVAWTASHWEITAEALAEAEGRGGAA